MDFLATAVSQDGLTDISADKPLIGGGSITVLSHSDVARAHEPSMNPHTQTQQTFSTLRCSNHSNSS